MPELPEVEILVRHLDPLIRKQNIKAVAVQRPKVIAPHHAREFRQMLKGATFQRVRRRAKYLVFELSRANGESLILLGHLGMTGRMYLQPKALPLPRHCPVALDLGQSNFIFEDTRYFGRLTFDAGILDDLGPEPLSAAFTPEYLRAKLLRSRQPLKVKLLDQTVLAGLGNIYASEALFRARLSPTRRSGSLKPQEARRLWRAIRDVLRQAIRCGSTVPLNFSGRAGKDKLFYFGQKPGTPDYYEERLRVYDREGRPCPNCKTPIRRFVQAGRSTFCCPQCQA